MKQNLIIAGGVALLVIIGAGGVFIFTLKNEPTQIACTQEAKLCPDGSAVGRTGPNCEFAKCPEDAPPVDENKSSFILEARIEKSVSALGVTLTPQNIVEDSRCATDVVCVWAGTVRLRVLLKSGLGETLQIFKLGEPITTEAEEITLTEVKPAPLAKTTIAPQDYRFTFIVKKRETSRVLGAAQVLPLVTPPPSSIKDPAGQLVHHVLNIKAAPSVKALAFSPDGHELWATMLLNTQHSVSVYNAETGKKTADIDLGSAGGVEILFSRSGTRAYVSQMETAKVFEIDVASKKILHEIHTKSSWTKVLELSPDGTTLYASNWLGNSVTEINLQDWNVKRTIKTVATPRGLYATGDGKYLYVAGFDKGEIQKIDLATGIGTIVYKSGGAMRHMVADEDRGVLYISDMAKNVIWQLELTDDSVKKFVSTDNLPNTIALSPDKKILYVSNRGKNFSADNYYVPGPEWGTVLLFDTSNEKMLDAIVGGNQPTALAVSPNGTRMAFSDFLDARIEVFDMPTYEVLASADGGRSAIYKKEIKKEAY
jgi:DNA-binding beta-propeller fold protein YncE